jgi:hypothetical protein
MRKLLFKQPRRRRKPYEPKAAFAALEEQRTALLARCADLEDRIKTLQSELDAALARHPERLAATPEGRNELATILGRSLNEPLFYANSEMRAELKDKATLSAALLNKGDKVRVPELHTLLTEATKSTGHGITTPTTYEKKRIRVSALEDEIVAARILNTPAPLPTAAAAVAYDTGRSRTVVDATAAATGSAGYTKVKSLVDEKLPPLALPAAFQDCDVIAIADNNQVLKRTWLNRISKSKERVRMQFRPVFWLLTSVL